MAAGESEVVKTARDVEAPSSSAAARQQAPGSRTPENGFKWQRPSWLTPFFGSNAPEPYVAPEPGHPCKLFSRLVHECLDRHDNNVDFCQSKLALLQSCLKDLNL